MVMAKQPAICEAAVLAWCETALADKKRVIEPGIHNVGGHRVIIDIPPLAAVTRSEGTAGDGFNSDPPEEIKITFGACRLLVEKMAAGQEPTEALWTECIREDLIRQSLEQAAAAFPLEALKALETVQEEQPKDPVKTKCRANRVGVELVKITIEPPSAKTDVKAAEPKQKANKRKSARV